MKNGNKRKGYTYSVSLEAIQQWKKVPPADKLRWLEEANRFIRQAASPAVKRSHARLRAGINISL
jgi:hypothetical protein